jgi:proteasome lid subunit RPN8/RPN11
MSKPVRLPRPLVRRIVRQARQAPDEEICGLLAGNKTGFTRCYPVPNVAPDKRRRFEMDPKGLIDALRTMREAGEELAAIYHSHPDSPPRPSATDIARSEYPGVLYLIISLRGRTAPELRGFRLRGRRFAEVPLGI